MEELDIIDIIEYRAIQIQSIYIALYSQGYCEPSNFNETVCFINSTDKETIIEQIAIFVQKMTKDYTFEFDDEFYGDEANFKIDGYKNVKIKNCNQSLKINFEDIEKQVYDKLVVFGFKTDYNPWK